MRFFDNAYEGTPTWDIGRPQPAVVRLAEAGELSGRILDLGCGTGENALYLASRGCQVVGVDFAIAAIERARTKARQRGVTAAFEVHDALRLGGLGRTFETALDVGLFHTLQPDERRPYAASVRAALTPGGRLFLLAWSNRNPFGRGPERIYRRDLRAAFDEGWQVESITGEVLATRLQEGRVQAWLARLRRDGDA